MMKSVLTVILAALIFSGCGKQISSEQESTDQDNGIPEEAQADSKTNSIDQSLGVADETSLRSFFEGMFDINNPAQSKDRFVSDVAKFYEKLDVPEFIDASKELTDYRNALVKREDLHSWLLASLIEKTITGSVLQKLEVDQLSPDEAYGIVKNFSVPMYDVDTMGKVVDGSRMIDSSSGFLVKEQEILKDKFGFDQSSLASEGYRYRALFEYIATTSNESNSLEPAGLETLNSLFQIFGTYRESLMVSIYTKHLSEGGEPLSQDSDGANSSAIETALNSQYLPEFHTLGSPRIRLHELRSLLREHQ